MGIWKIRNIASRDGVGLYTKIQVKSAKGILGIIQDVSEIPPDDWGEVKVTAVGQGVKIRFYTREGKKMPGTLDCEVEVNQYGANVPELFFQVEYGNRGLPVLRQIFQ